LAIVELIDMCPSVSVVIPVYNSQDYLPKCLESLLLYEEGFLELLLVNDGSTDDSLKVCEAYANNNSNIVLINKQNEGVSESRNIGTQRAKGKYILYMDSDDWLVPLALYNMYHFAERYDCDIVQCGFYYAYKDYLLFDRRTKKEYPNPVVLSKDQAMEYLVRNRVVSNFVWAKLYKKALVQNHSFRHDVSMGEDFYWMHRVIHEATKVGVISEPGYFYRQNSESLSSSFSKRHVSLLQAYEDRLLFVKKNYKYLYGDMLYLYWLQSLAFMNISKKTGLKQLSTLYMGYWNDMNVRYEKDLESYLRWKPEYFMFHQSKWVLKIYRYARRIYTRFFNDFQRIELK